MLPPGTPDLLSLDLLDSIAELGSLSQAAVRHRLSQPAVSMRMGQLERALGASLLERGPGGTRLTPVGAQVAALGRRVLGEVHAMMAAVDALVAQEASHLRVAASFTIAEHLLPGWIGALKAAVPDVVLAVEVTNTARVIAQVRDGHVDAGFIEGDEGHLDGLGSVIVGRDRLEVVVSPAHPWAARHAPVTGPELAAAELILREPGSGTRAVLEATLRPWGGPRSRLELGSTASILAAARRGEAPAVLSGLAVADDLAAGRLVRIPTRDVDLTRSLRAVWAHGRPLAPLARRLLDAALSAGPA
jgi:DNA-binding transcriptional LysR family regulator